MLSTDTGHVVSTALKCGSADWESKLLFLNSAGDSVGIINAFQPNGFMRSTNDGNILFLGGTSAGLTYDTIKITKATYSGDTLWNTLFFFPECNNQVYDAINTQDGGYAITGIYSIDSCQNTAHFNAFVVKLNAQGDMQWSNTFGGPEDDQLFNIYERANGELVAGGWTKNTLNADSDIWILSMNSNGDSLSSITYGEPNIDELAYGMTTTYNGQYVLQYYSDSIYALKLDESGAFVWQRSLGVPSGGRYFQVKETSDLQYVFLSCRNSSFGCASHLTKLKRDGELNWEKTWGGLMRDVVEDTAGSFLLAGYTTAFPNPSKLHVVRFDTIVDDLDTTSINELPYSMFVNLYPNPTQRQVTINCLSGNILRVQLFDLQGKEVMNKQQLSSNSTELDVSLLQKGVYMVKVLNREQQSTYRKLIIH